MSALSVSVPPFCAELTLTLRHACYAIDFVKQVLRLVLFVSFLDFVPYILQLVSFILPELRAYLFFSASCFKPVFKTIVFFFDNGKSLGLDPLFFYGPDLFA